MPHSVTFNNNDHYIEYESDGEYTDIVISHIIMIERVNSVSLGVITSVGKEVLVFDNNTDREAARTSILSKL